MDSLLLSRLVLAVVKVSAFVVANQLIAHQTMNVISLPMPLSLQAKHCYNKFLCLQKPCYNIVMQSYRNGDKRTLVI